MERTIYIEDGTLALAEFIEDTDNAAFWHCWQDEDTQRGYNHRKTTAREDFTHGGVTAGFLSAILRKTDGEPIGGIFLSEGDMPDLAIMIFPPHRGQGYATRAFALGAAYCFETFHMKRLYAGCYPHNTASMKMLARCGFRPHPEGNVAEKHYLTGEEIMQMDFVKNNPMPSEHEAEALLNWAHDLNPGPWAAHCRVAARAAKTIAHACGLDEHRAYVFGLLHDIGRYEGVRGLHHVYAGYALMREKGYGSIAKICLSHSFPFQDLGAFGGGALDCTVEETAEIETFLATVAYDDYDRLIQLCDALCTAQGVRLMEARLLDVVRRYGFDDFTLRKWDAVFALKADFDTRCDRNIYGLFREELQDSIFA